jgi:hypothetical protein
MNIRNLINKSAEDTEKLLLKRNILMLIWSTIEIFN